MEGLVEEEVGDLQLLIVINGVEVVVDLMEDLEDSVLMEHIG